MENSHGLLRTKANRAKADVFCGLVPVHRFVTEVVF